MQQFLLERVPLHGGLVDLNAESRARVGADDAAFGFDCEAFRHDLIAPRHVVVDGLADEIARLREPELQRGGGTDRSLRVVRCQRNPMRVGQGCDPSRGGQSTAVRDVELADFAPAFLKEVAECARSVIRSPVATGVVIAALIAASPSIDSGQHGSSKK